VVNVASKCGLTPQYEGLQKLQEEFGDRGFTILGFPANNFLAQEPGTDSQIAEFCSTNFKVSFPLFSKISVKGTDQHPLYTWLTTSEPEPGEIKWNFHKFLIAPDGKKLKNFPPTTEPAALREVILQHLP
jgi:glutathione peroxidase